MALGIIQSQVFASAVRMARSRRQLGSHYCKVSPFPVSYCDGAHFTWT